MAIVAVLSLLTLFAGLLLVPTHLWWGEPFATWRRSDGSRIADQWLATLAEWWRALSVGRSRQQHMSNRLERFAESQSMDVALVNPFGQPEVAPRYSLRALANGAAPAARHASSAASEAAPAREASSFEGIDSPIVKVDSPMNARLLAEVAGPGDIWLNLSRFDGWVSVRQRRAFLVEEIARHPEWADPDIFAIAIALGIWDDAGRWETHLSRNRQRVRRLRAAVEQPAEGRSAA